MSGSEMIEAKQVHYKHVNIKKQKKNEFENKHQIRIKLKKQNIRKKSYIQ